MNLNLKNQLLKIYQQMIKLINNLVIKKKSNQKKKKFQKICK